MAHIQELASTIEEADANGIAKQRIGGAGANLVRVVVPAGTFAAGHHHEHEEFVQVISGEVEPEEGVKVFGPGSLFILPPATWHAARFETETVLVETSVYR